MLNDRFRLLIVDDDPHVLETMEAVLQDHYDVTTASGTLGALEVLASRPIDVVCTDHRMPSLDGIQLLRRARRDHHHLGTILISGADSAQISEHSSVDAFVSKPCDPERLVRIIEQIGKRAERRTAGRGHSAPTTDAPTTPTEDTATDE